jgi:hypothetical protein
VVLRGGSPCAGIAAPAVSAEEDGTRLDARLEAVRLLGRLESPAAIPPLIEALHFPDPEINRVAAEGLERRGPAAAAAASALEGVARTHWSRAVAKAAAAAHFAIAGTAVEVPAAPPSVPYERGDHRWDVLIGKETRRASDAPDPNEETRRGSSPPLRDCERLKIKCEGRRWKTLRAGEDSLALIDVGEFGSFVIARGPHTDEKQLWSELDLIDLFRLSGDYFLLTKAGRVVRLVPPRPPGEWTAQLVTVLPGSPRVWEILPDALLVVVLENSPEPLSDPQTVAAYSVNAAGIVMRHPLRRVPGSAEPAPAK